VEYRKIFAQEILQIIKTWGWIP